MKTKRMGLAQYVVHLFEGGHAAQMAKSGAVGGLKSDGKVAEHLI